MFLETLQGKEKNKEELLSQFLEEAWNKLPYLLQKLPRDKKLKYLEIVIKEIGLRGTINSIIKGDWKEILNSLTPSVIKAARERAPSYVIDNSQAKAIIAYELYLLLLEDMNKIAPSPPSFFSDKKPEKEYGEALPFMSALEELISSAPLPQRNYSNRITPVNTQTLAEALNFLNKL